jgi:heme-degrading monooxygenase HmoA
LSEVIAALDQLQPGERLTITRWAEEEAARKWKQEREAKAKTPSKP